MTLFPQSAIDGPAPPAAPAVPRNATRAWILSLLVPGAGQLYCGARTRGVATLVIFSACVAVFVLTPVRWIGVRLAIMLYAFAGLDAYLTAVEVNRGVDPDAEDNPRVAGLLNLTTHGFGYVYLGWKFGFVLFLLLVSIGRAFGMIAPLLVEAVSFALAADAFRSGRKEREEVYGDAVRNPAPFPWAVAGTILGAYALLVLIGQVVVLVRLLR